MRKIYKYINTGITLLIIVGSVIILYTGKKDNNLRVNNSNIRRSLYETALDTLFPVSNNGSIGFTETVEQIMGRNKFVKIDSTKYHFRLKNEVEVERDNLPQNPESQSISRYPKSDSIAGYPGYSPQTVSTSFTGATLSGTNPTGSFPPDDMGAVGPTQFIVAVNGRLVTFNKTTGVADGVLNTTMDNFWVSVMTPPASNNFTSDPRIRYDRLSGRWITIIIDVPGMTGSLPNRILIAVSNSSTITNSTVWTYFFIPIDTTPPAISSTCFADYPTLGVDVNALYIGTNNFCSGTFSSTDGYVIKKSTLLSGTLNVTVFRGLVASASSAGPYTPQGVDNFDAGSTEGYFIGTDNATYGTLMIRRVSNPGGTPSISSNISLTVPTTYSPITVRHLGNTGGTSGRLDALDDRLFAAQMRNGRLWTSHSFNVSNTGVASTTSSRNGCRWYEIQNLSTTPSLVQSGTVYFPNTVNGVNDRNYWIPSVNVSGQGHVAMVFSTSGNNERVNVGTVGRLSSDPLGTMQTPVLITSSSTAYNPSSDPGGTSGRRWGDYSYVSVDPDDDMTMWCVHQFCDAANSYGVRATKLVAPPPAAPVSSAPNTVSNVSSVSVVITGSSVSGSGWFDPGTGFTKRINATLSNGATLNSITYTDPTHVTLDINTSVANVPSSPNADVPIYVTIINPDGQFSTSSSPIITVQGALPVQLASFNSAVSGRNVILKWITSSEQNNSGFEIQKSFAGNNGSKQDPQGYYKIGFVSGKGTTNVSTNYEFTDSKLNSGKYKYRLKQIDVNGNFQYFELNGDVEISLPGKFNMSQNYPNPFNPNTKIDFDLPYDCKVNILLYDINGREVKTLVNETKTAGYHSVQFNASDLSSGIYFYRIITKSASNDFVMTKKMMLLK